MDVAPQANLPSGSRTPAWFRLSKISVAALVVSTMIVSAATLIGIRNVERMQERNLLASRSKAVTTAVNAELLATLYELNSFLMASSAGPQQFMAMLTSLSDHAPKPPPKPSDSASALQLVLMTRGTSGWTVGFGVGPDTSKVLLPGPVADALQDPSSKAHSVIAATSRGRRLIEMNTVSTARGLTRVAIILPTPEVGSAAVTGFDGLDVAVYLGASTDPQSLVLSTTTVPSTGDHVTRQSLDVGNDHWLVVIGWHKALDGPLAHNADKIGFGVGMLITLLLVGMIEMTARRRNFALALVDDRTAQLRQSLSDLECAQEQLQHRADHDALTGLLNRHGFSTEADRQAALARRYGAGGVLLTLDLDHFKAVNDTLGHKAGDELLARVANLITTHVRDSDVVARLGGDEFAVILPRDDPDTGALVARKILDVLRDELQNSTHEAERAVTASAGMAEFTAERTAEQVLVHADLAMYEAKHRGRDQLAEHPRNVRHTAGNAHGLSAVGPIAEPT